MRKGLSILPIICMYCCSTHAFEVDDYILTDLSHTYNDNTLYWPTSTSRFEKTGTAGALDAGWFYSAYTVCTPEHGGTHLDAPVHFNADGVGTEQIPLQNLIAPAVVIDVAANATEDRNYRLRVQDIIAFEEKHGEIVPGTIVLLRTGFSKYWPDARSYLGDDTPGDASKLSFPGFGVEAVALLVENRGVKLLGIDSASIDYGPSQDFISHRVAAAQGVANLENLTNLDKLPATGAIVMALPMKIGGGSGGPVRVVALVPK
jgi:kynurenine formamidase